MTNATAPASAHAAPSSTSAPTSRSPSTGATTPPRTPPPTDMAAHPPAPPTRKPSFMAKLRDSASAVVSRSHHHHGSSRSGSTTPSTTPPHSPKLAHAPPSPTPAISPSHGEVPPPVMERKPSFKDLLKSRTLSLGRSKSAGEAAAAAGHSSSTSTLVEKYGVCEKGCIGKGATAVVKLVHKLHAESQQERVYAVKEFRKRRKNESERNWAKKVMGEFCISSSLHHINVVETIDLIQDENEHWCEVMEFCAGGDLYSVIKTGKMTMEEINCCFKQLIYGLNYLHVNGVCHKDLKPENLLLSADGHLKITDFGVSEVFKMCWEAEPHLSKGVCGSEPYIAPEEYLGAEYDGRLVDVWACGIIYYAMLYQGIPWRHATKDDPNFSYYVANRLTNFEALDRLTLGCRDLMYKILDPNPATRATVADILSDLWFQQIQLCFDCDEYDAPATSPLAPAVTSAPRPHAHPNHVHHINPITPPRSRSNSNAAANAVQAAAAAAAAANAANLHPTVHHHASAPNLHPPHHHAPSRSTTGDSATSTAPSTSAAPKSPSASRSPSRTRSPPTQGATPPPLEPTIGPAPQRTSSTTSVASVTARPHLARATGARDRERDKGKSAKASGSSGSNGSASGNGNGAGGLGRIEAVMKDLLHRH
ncbi:serine/threonine-protein kinase HAL4/sat4 [Allomyces javanicus]|nr:serine/threonine-protein kinase HAL4/sat4 [Allomyces javanicus]